MKTTRKRSLIYLQIVSTKRLALEVIQIPFLVTLILCAACSSKESRSANDILLELGSIEYPHKKDPRELELLKELADMYESGEVTRLHHSATITTLEMARAVYPRSQFDFERNE